MPEQEHKGAHTKGPRLVARNDCDDGSIYYAVHGENYEFIANFDKKADAYLDAVAPDLLAALQAILECGDVYDMQADFPEPIAQARAAISRATT